MVISGLISLIFSIYKMNYYLPRNTYVNGTYGKVTFGGITNMELVGETNESIPINAFIIDELNDGDLSNDVWINQEDIHYFSPDPDELVDRKEQNYPKAGKPFYVKFSDPQNGKNEVAIKGLRASSECLSDCHGIVSIYEAISYTLEYSESKRTKEVVSVENGEPQYSDEKIADILENIKNELAEIV